MFKSEYFYWNGIYSKDMGISLISFDSDVLNDYGLTYSSPVKKNGSFGGNALYSKEEYDCPEITLNLCLEDKDGNATTWDDFKLQEVLSWIITDDFKRFVSCDNLQYAYYFKVVEIVKKMNAVKQGYLEVTFQPYSQYVYSEHELTFDIDGSSNVNIMNYSNVDKTFSPLIVVTNLGDDNTVNSIRNISNSDEYFLLTNVKCNEEITIDNMSYVVINENGDNRFSNCNRKWIRLNQGVNSIEIKGKCTVTFICNFPIIT